jgi:kynurenine formamidase
MKRSAMEVVDLTHAICADMPVFPGTPPPILENAFVIERNGFAEKMLHLVSHTGTHIDAPGHILPGAPRLDAFAAGSFVGAGVVLDASSVRGRSVGLADIERYGERLRGAAFALLHTGWAKFWGTDDYFGRYPVLAPEAAGWLAGFGLQGYGVDAISADEIDSTALPVHRALLGRGMLIVENLAGLEPLLEREFTFSCLPLKIADADGSPIRAVAILSRDA